AGAQPPARLLAAARARAAPGPPRRVRGEHGRAFQKGRRGGKPAARLGPACRTLEIPGDVLIRLACRLGAVPRPAFGIGLRVSGGRPRLVHPPPGVRPCRGPAHPPPPPPVPPPEPP